jgi:hypothetical protein
MSCATQLGFSHRLKLGPRRMLIPLEFCMVTFSRDEDQVLELVENGVLAPSWNLATRADGRRRKIHIWRGAVEDYDPEDDNLGGVAAPPHRAELDDIIDLCLPSDLRSPTSELSSVRGTELAWRFCCSMDLIADLIRDGELAQAGPAARPKESPQILRASVTQFLRRRAL